MKRQNILLDTCILLWAISDHPALSTKNKQIICSTDICFVSAVSIAEIEIKRSINKLRIDGEYLEAITQSGFELTSYRPEDARRLEKVPVYHKDPFDRMLIAQAQARDLAILTADASFDQYDVRLAG